MNALTVRGLYKAYGDFSLELDLSVGEEETVVVAGPSGCGKSTLLMCVAGLSPMERGSVELFGRDAAELPPWRRSSAVVFQEPALFPHLTVAGNVGFGPFLKGMDRRRRKELVRRNLEAVRLSGKERRRTWELSGGERQRVAIARALAASPRLLLMDEPFSSLDAPLRAALRRDFRELSRREGFACLFVTHDRDEAAALADRLVVLRDGRIAEEGPPEALFSSPRSAFAAEFLGVGAVLPVLGPPRPERSSGSGLMEVPTALGIVRAEGGSEPPDGADRWGVLFPRGSVLPAAAGAQGGDGVRAIVSGSEFQRDRYACEAVVGDAKVQFWTREGETAPPEGTTVDLVVASDARRPRLVRA